MVNGLLKQSGRLGLKLLGPFMLIVLVSLVGAIGAVVVGYNTRLHAAEQLQQEIAIQAAAQIDDFVQTVQDSLRHGTNHFSHGLESDDGHIQTLKLIKQTSPALYRLALIDSTGQEIAAVVGLKPVAGEHLENHAGQPKFTRSLTGQEYIGPVYISEFRFPFASFSAPVFNGKQQVIGVLSAEVDISQMWNDVTEIANRHPDECPDDSGPPKCPVTIYVVDQRGRLIAVNSNTARTQGLPQLVQVANPIAGVTDLSIAGVQAYLNSNFAPLQYTGLKDEAGAQVNVIGARQVVRQTGWGVIVERPVTVATRQINTFALTSFGLILLIVIIVSLTGAYIIRNVITPLNVLRRGVAMLAQGNFDHPIRVSTGDEIEYLANEFNHMSINLFESQQSLADAAEENADLYRQEQRRAQELTLVNRINQTVMASLDVETTIDAVLRNLKTLLNYKSAEINLWDPETRTLKAHAVGDTAYTAAAGHRYTMHEGFTGWLARNRRPLFLPSVEESQDASPKLPLPAFPYKSYLGVPLTVGPDFLGTLELAHPEPNTYTQQDLESLQTLAGQAAVAIRHAQVFQDSQERALAQEQLAYIASLAVTSLNLDELLTRIMTKTVEALGATMGAVLLLNRDETELYPHPAGVIGIDPADFETFKLSTASPQFQQSVLLTGRPFWTNNAATDKRILPLYRPFIEQFKVTTALVVPLTTADKNIGEVYLLNKPTPFRNRDVTFLASVAVHFATAIQNATLFQTTQHSLNELSILYKSTADLASTLSVEEVLGNLAERMVSILPADECAIFRVDETAGLLESFVDQPLPGSDPARPIADYPLTARVLKTRQPVVVCADNPQADEAELALLKQQGYNVLLMLPLVARSRAIGLVKLYATQDITYRPEDINLAQAMANQAAMALENAQLYTEADEQLKLRLKELSGLQKVIHELNSTLVFENIIRLVIEEAVRATGADFGNVTLYDSQTKHYKTHVHAGWPPEAVDSIPTITDQMGIMGRVLRQKMPEIVDDVSKDPDYIPFPIPSRSEMVVPIQYADVVEGVINLESTRPAAFTRHQLQYVQALADQAAIAIRNAQAFEEQVKERRDAATRANQLAQLSEINRAFRANRPLEFILEEIAFAIQETVGFNIVLLSVVRHNHLHRITGAGLPIVELNKARQKPQPLEFLSQVMQPDFKMGDSFFIPAERRDIWQGKIDVVFSEIAAAGAATPPDHIWQTEDLLFTPLKDAEGAIIGLLSVDAPRNGLRPTPQVVTVLELFANQAATAIENTNLFRELERQATHLKLSGQISARISGILNPAELMGEVVNLIANAFNYYYVQIYQPDARQPTLLLAKDGAGAAGVNHKILDPNRRLPIDERSIAGWVAAHRRPLIVNDVEQDSRYMPVEHLPETRSELAVPITAGQILVGVLDIQHNQPHAFSKDSLDNMQTLAGQLSVAVQNAQLFDEALQRERLSSALGHTGLIFNATLDPNAIFDVICREAISAFQVDGAFLWLVENGQARGVAAAGSKSGAFIGKTISLTETRVLGIRIIQEKRAEYINGVDFADEAMDHSLIKEFNVRSVMGAPLIVGDQTLGALIMIDSHNPNRFDIQDQISVTLLANQAAIAIQNAQLVDRLNRFAEELEQRVDVRTDQLRQERDRVDTLYKIARGLSSSLDLDRVLNEALSLINQTINITRGAILLVDDATGSLHYRAAYGRKPPLPKGGKPTPYRMGVGLAGRVLETREPINVANLADNEDWISDGKPSPHRSVLAVPLITGFEIVGVLMLYHAETGYFTADHMRLVTAAAPIIATAINNAGLYKLISEQVERLGVLLGTVRAEARKNEAIVEGIADGVLVLDDDLAIQLVNPAAANILGMQREFLQGQRLSMISARNPVTIEEKLVYELCRYITNPQPELQGEEERGPHRIEVDPKVVLVILSSVTLSPNAPASTLVVLRDISREAELERIKNEFISTVSHELRTPMTSIKGYTDLLASDKVGPLTAIQMKFVQVIKNNADRLTALVNDILDISRIDTGRVKLDLQYIDLTPLLGEVVASFSHQLEEKNLSLTVRIPEQLPPVFADYNRATQIMVNLVGNAVKYTRPGDSITVSANLNPREVQINVQDSGLGIAPEDKERVFNRFFRSERDVTSLVGGTGLGLPIAKMFVEMMGGEIWLESELGAGTTFSFTLPLQDQRIEESRVVESLAGRRRILVVDDNTDIVDVLKRQLEVEGYNVVTTLNGSQVLELAKQHHPSLITLDIMLDDIDGFEVLAQLKADPETKDIPVVIASVLNDAARRGMALGAADYLVKPFDKANVLTTIQRLVDTLGQNGDGLSVQKILIVDDDKDIVNWLRTALSESGFKARGAFNGQEAMLLVKEDPPDLILLDLKMPGMDGVEVIQKLKEQPDTADIPIIVITGSSIDHDSDTIKVLGMGAGHMLTKPFSLDELVSEIKRLELPPAAGSEKPTTQKRD